MELVADINCPSCKRALKVKIKEMVPGRKKKCLGCGAEIVFAGDDMRKAQRSLDDLTKKIKNVFK
jgi:hypothetical protein